MMRPLTRALNDSKKFKYKAPDSVVDFLVVGGGVVGLAIAQRLCRDFPRKSTYLVERHDSAGQETSSRNSEVIHAGLYYPIDSLKSRLCLRGRHLMYERCEEYNIPYRKTGKLVVAKSHQKPYIEGLHQKCSSLKWPLYALPKNHEDKVLPTTLLRGDAVREMEPDISRDIVAGLWCPETGIVDSHSLMESLEKDIIESEGGELVYSSRAVRMDPYLENNPTLTQHSDSGGWVVQLVTGDGQEGDALLARNLINAAGLSSTLFVNSLLPPEKRLSMYYAKGSYAAYKGAGVSNVSHLIYPCPDTGPNAHAFQSLGTHLTLDLEGKIRFGPDLEWISPPDANTDPSEGDTDFWNELLIPDETRLSQMHQAVTDYLPGVKFEGMQPDYCGIRPKLVGPGGGFQDFVFRRDLSRLDGRNAMISLLGIESPGLTSSLAIAEYVVQDILITEL